MKKIGILLIHGIGDQAQYRHLHEFTEFLSSGLCDIYGRHRVAIEAPGIRTQKGQAPVSILVSQREDAGEPTEEFHLYEMWWRDLAQQPRFTAILWFWLWATTLVGTRGFFCDEGPNRVNPTDRKGRPRKKIGLSYRLTLFFKTTYIFLLLAPAALVFNLLRLIPGVGHIPFIRAVFVYLNSVQLYQDTRKKISGTLTDFDHSRRLSIQRRLANLMLTLHESDCDYWFIFAHSLGSVIGFKGLMYDGRAFARLMSHDRWNHPNLRDLKCVIKGDHYQDIPRAPNWLKDDDALQVDQILSRLRGFVTYGSPLETFARTWPGIVQINPDTGQVLKHGNSRDGKEWNCEWLNIYDPADLIASPLRSFEGGKNPCLSGISPQEIPIRSSISAMSAHVKYFNGRPILKDVIRWMENDGSKFSEIRRTKNLPRHRVALRRLAVATQLFLLFLVGGFIWPFSIFVLISTLQFAIERTVVFLTDVLQIFVTKIWFLGIIGYETTQDGGRFCRIQDERSGDYYVNLSECVDQGLMATKSFIQSLAPIRRDLMGSTSHFGMIIGIVAGFLLLAALARAFIEWLSRLRGLRSGPPDAVHAAVLQSGSAQEDAAG